MKSRAAIALAPKQPLVIDEIEVGGPRSGEVLIEIKATGVCHTDAYTLSGADPEGLFPAVLGHEGAGVVVDVGPGVKSLAKGDHVIPLYVPECRECSYCTSGKTNLCQAIRETQGKGLMPDGSSRFARSGTPLLHYMGTSTFSQLHGRPRDRGRQDPRRRAVRQGLLHRLRRDDGNRRRDQHRPGPARRQRGRVRPRRHRPERDPGRAHGRRRADRRRRRESEEARAGGEVRHDRLREPDARSRAIWSRISCR